MAFLATVSLIAVESLLILNSGERRRKDLKGIDTEQLSAFLWHLIHGWIRLGTDCRPHLDCNLSNDLISILFALFINFRDRSGRGNSMNKRYICQLDQFYSFSRAPPFLRSFGLIRYVIYYGNSAVKHKIRIEYNSTDVVCEYTCK